MEDLFKKFINAGVGFVSMTNDRVQSTIDKLVQESKLSEQEGAKIMDDLKKNTDSKRKELEKQLQGISSRILKSVGVAPNAEVEELKRTVKGAGSKTSSSSASSAAAKGSSSSAKGTSPAAKPTPAVKSATAKSGSTSSKAKASGGESKETKATKTAAKKAISPNDNTSSSGSQLS